MCEGVSLGANATILCGIKVGEFCMVGAGALITKDALYSLMIGVPAYQKGWVSYSGEILDESLICPRDKIKYFIKNNRLKKNRIAIMKKFKLNKKFHLVVLIYNNNKWV